MNAGSGIALAAVGAIAAFAVQDRISGVDLTMLGYILMGAGVLVALLALVMANQKRSHDTQVVTTDGAGRQEVRESHVESTPPT